MSRQRSIASLSVAELRNLLIEKTRAERRARVEHFRRTGRVIVLDTHPTPPPLEKLHSDLLLDEETLTAPPARKRSWLDRLLIVVELAAVVGFAFILYNIFGTLNLLNQEVATSLTQPTLAPTPIIQAVVLPGGHTPPLPGEEVLFDVGIPEHLKPMQQAYLSLPVPTPGPASAIRIQIPAIYVDAPVVQGDGKEQLKKGVGQMIGSPDPGQRGNLVLSAHNDIFGEIFRDLDQLKPGDKIILFTNQRTYTYIVSPGEDGKGFTIVEPFQVEVLNQTPEATLTLISCYPYRVDTQRIIVKAYLQDQP